jgi:DNA-binding GntR family transcriptional regulator
MKPISAVDVAKSYLEERIVKGTFAPGQQIKEGDISARLHISRPPIREAFKLLEAEGLIDRKPNRGVFVSQIRKRDVWEVYTLLECLYELALRLAFDRVSDKEIRKLEGLVLEMESCVARHSPKVIGRYQDLNRRFHGLFARIVGHRRLDLILSHLSAQIRRLSYQAFLDKEHMRRSNQAHRAILEALRRKDMDKAAVLSRQHMQAIAVTHRRLAGGNE